jgi:hypothetical protein
MNGWPDVATGDRLSGRWAKMNARREIWAVLYKLRYPLAGMYVCIGCVGWIADRATAHLGGAWWRGALSGAVISGFTMQLVWYIATATRSSNRWMGGDAERSVAQRLDGLRVKGWATQHHVRFLLEHRDIDHVVVGKAGVFVLETKWLAFAETESRYEAQVIQEAVRNLDEQSRKVGLRFQAALGRKLESPPTSVLVVCGGWLDRPPSMTFGKVSVVRESELVGWLEALPEVFVDGAEFEYQAALQRLPARDDSDEAQAGDSFVIRYGLEGAFHVAVSMFVGFAAATLCVMFASRVSSLLLLCSVGTGILAALGVDRCFQSRHSRDSVGLARLVRAAAFGWTSALSLVPVLALISYVWTR